MPRSWAMDVYLGARVADRGGAEGEEAFIRRLAAYDAGAWQRVYALYYRPIFRLAYVRTFQQALSEDIAAEVLSEAARGIGRYRYRGVPFRAWLFKIANNVIADYLKAQLRRPQVYLDAVEDSHPGLAVPAAFDEVEGKADFLLAIEDLTEDQKTALTLRFVNDLSLEECAESMGKSVGAIKQLQHRALTTLRRQIPAREGVEP